MCDKKTALTAVTSRSACNCSLLKVGSICCIGGMGISRNCSSGATAGFLLELRGGDRKSCLGIGPANILLPLLLLLRNAVSKQTICQGKPRLHYTNSLALPHLPPPPKKARLNLCQKFQNQYTSPSSYLLCENSTSLN